MAGNQTIVFRAKTSQDAHLLRNLLAEAGITAMVTNDVLEGGSGVDMVGWPTLAQVVVDEEDAQRARQFAVDFDRGLYRQVSDSTPEDPSIEPTATIDVWPRCPECDAMRITRCKICGTTGTDFQPVDMGFDWIPGTDAMAKSSACSCGPEGCPSGKTPAEEPDPVMEDNAKPLSMLMCPTCDEPFVPEYPRVCEWCGHEFPDGFEPELLVKPQRIGGRAILVMAGLLTVAFVIMGYFALLLRS